MSCTQWCICFSCDTNTKDNVTTYYRWCIWPTWKLLLHRSVQVYLIFGTGLLLTSHCCEIPWKIVLYKNRVYRVDSVMYKKKLHCSFMFQATGGSWCRRITDSKRFCRKLWLCHSSLWLQVGSVFGMSNGGQCHVFKVVIRTQSYNGSVAAKFKSGTDLGWWSCSRWKTF